MPRPATAECPVCQCRLRVIESRVEGDRRSRRYECGTCNIRFTTYEITAEEYRRLQLLEKAVNNGTS